MEADVKQLLVSIAVISTGFAGNVAVDLDPAESDYEWLMYHDGTPEWCTWDGVYRGVWFNMDDFVPGTYLNTLEETEFWFYHDTSYPWDTSNVYVEVWNGEASGPWIQLTQTMVTAVSYAPVYDFYYPNIQVDQEFWVLVNTEMSAGGWPSLLGDGGPVSTAHSFHSDDFINWQPWSPDGLCNYLISANWFGWGLDGITWGSVKTVF